MSGKAPAFCHVLLLTALAGAHCPTQAAVDERVFAAENARVEVADRIRAATVAIFGADGAGGGSGVLISPDGYALTNFHVAQPSGAFLRCGIPDGNLYDAVIVGADPTGDVALIKLVGKSDFPTATLGDSDTVRTGDWVFVVGNPFLLAHDFQPTVTYGIISGVHRYQYPAGTILEYTDCLQTDAAINPGNSGGPLFNAAGELIGINGRGSFEKRGRVNVGVGYAISINQIKNFLGCLRGGHVVDHATLGAVVAAGPGGYSVVSDILEDSDAYRRGLRYDDTIVRLRDRPIRTPNEFKNVLGIFPKSWRIPMVFRRQGREYQVLVRLRGVHPASQLADLMQGVDPLPPPENPPEGEQRPNRPGRRPHSAARPAMANIPETVRGQYEFRRGFANYHFNRVERDRVWRAVQSQGNAELLGPTWSMTGSAAQRGPFTLEIDEGAARAKFPTGALSVRVEEEGAGQFDLPQSGGVLRALGIWRRFLRGGPAALGGIDYFGTAPLAGGKDLVDVLQGSFSDTEVWIYVDPAEGSLLALELFAGTNGDPCEIYFHDYRPVQQCSLPHRFEIRHGDDVYDVWTIGSYSGSSHASE